MFLFICCVQSEPQSLGSKGCLAPQKVDDWRDLMLTQTSGSLSAELHTLICGTETKT